MSELIPIDELVSFNSQGFIPGPSETDTAFIQRVKETQLSILKMGEETLPPAHWDMARNGLYQLFGFVPHCIPAFYSNRHLMPWQGAASWVERERILAIQLRKNLRKGSFLGIYLREEILAHEAVHAARSAFATDRWDELFAYMTARRRWHRALGPIIQRPWEVWPLLVLCALSSFSPLLLWSLLAYVSLGFIRLMRAHWILRKAAKTLHKCSDAQIRAILFRLTDAEIMRVANGAVSWEAILGALIQTPRGRLLVHAYPL